MCFPPHPLPPLPALPLWTCRLKSGGELEGGERNGKHHPTSYMPPPLTSGISGPSASSSSEIAASAARRGQGMLAKAEEEEKEGSASVISSVTSSSAGDDTLAKAQEEHSSDQSRVTDKRGGTQSKLPSAKAQKVGKTVRVNKGSGAKSKSKQPRRLALTGPNSSIQKWGTVYDPTLSWGKMPVQQDLVGGGKKYFDHYAQEAAAYNNVYDPVTDNHSPDLTNWVKNDPQGREEWWVHDHMGRGY